MKYFVFCFLSLFYLLAPCQDQNWIFTNAYNANLPISGGININFSNTSNPIITPFSSSFNINHSSACISSPTGRLLFYTNGTTIMNGATNDSMINGKRLGKEYWDATSDTFGLIVPQAVLILPSPKDTTEYYVFYETTILKSNAQLLTDTFLYSKVTYPIGLGNGIVTDKDVVITTANMEPGGITACKHGNGKDWWIIKSGKNSNENRIFLLTENGITTQNMQFLGANTSMNQSYYLAVFSPDGSKYIKFGDSLNQVLVYDFDRCTGQLSSLKIFQITAMANLSITTSPNSRFLYIINTSYSYAYASLFQIDLWASNLQNGIKTVVEDDIYTSLGGHFSLGAPQLAADGKIYISGDGIFHIIHEPDSEGVACQVEMRALNMPSFGMFPLPNMPNYRLGPKRGSACDTLTTAISSPIEALSGVYPNPSSEEVHILRGEIKGNILLKVWNEWGQMVYEQKIAREQKEVSFSVKVFSEGIYFYELVGEKQRQTGKFVKLQ